MDQLAESPGIDETIDLPALFAHLVAKRWWIVVCVVISTLAFSAVAFLSPPIYRAIAVLAPADLDQDDSILNSTSALGGLASTLGIGPRDTRTEEALAVLQSRQFTEDFITDKKLMPIFFSGKLDFKVRIWKADRASGPTLAKAYKYFDKKIRSITQDRRTGLITLQIDWTDRREAADWANDLVRRLNDEMRMRAMGEADASLDFLMKELQGATTVEARDAIGRLMEAQVKQRMLAHVTQDYSLRVVDRAITSDGAEPVKPRKLLLLILGPLTGLCVGCLLVAAFGSWPTTKRAESQ